MDKLHKCLFELLANIIVKNFYFENIEDYLKKLFVDEEVNERQTHVIRHSNLVKNVLGNDPKLLLKDWISSKDLKEYPLKRKKPIKFENQDTVRNKDLKQEDYLDLDKVGHNERKVVSVIDTFKWDKAGWLGFGVVIYPQFVGIILPFENESIGIEIFDDLRKRIGDEDKENLIEVAIIKGVNKNNPYWYRVHLTSGIKRDGNLSKKLLTTSSRIHEMNAKNEKNLKNLLDAFQYFRKYRLMPAKFEKEIIPFPKHSIEKYHLRVRSAWEIGIDDQDSAAIQKGDEPIIPKSETNAPIIELLKKLNGE